MLAMVLHEAGDCLRAGEVPIPEPDVGQILIKVEACAVCRTDLHILDGDLKRACLPLIPGHEAIGRVVKCGQRVEQWKIGSRVAVPWLAHACGACDFCRTDMENLCDAAKFTGYDVNGGYAEYMLANAQFVFGMRQDGDPVHLAPLMCAGLIGFRSYAMAGPGLKVGLFGFGAAAHLITQVALFEQRRVFAFVRNGDTQGLAFARKMGVYWAGFSGELPPEALDSAIIFAPVGELVPHALRCVRKGGTVVCGGIHMSDIPQFSYDLLWGERSVKSVANLTRKDGEAFLDLAFRIPIETTTTTYPLSRANEALQDLRRGTLNGAAVLIPDKLTT